MVEKFILALACLRGRRGEFILSNSKGNYMGRYYKNSIFWTINSNEDFSQENFNKWESKIEDIDRIQINSSLHEISQSNLQELYKRLFQKRKSLHLRIYGYNKQDLSLLTNFIELESLSIESSEQILNMGFLANFKKLDELHLVCDNQESFDFLWDINSSLKKLSIATYSKKKTNLDITPISNFKELKYLYLKEYNKSIEAAISPLVELETLALRSISKPKNLDFISHLSNLKDLIIQSCSFENITAISKLPNIRYLQLWKLAKINDINVVSLLSNLQHIFVETLNGVEKFPEVSNLSKLRRIKIVSCKNLRDFSSIEKSQSLTDFIIQNAKNSNIDDFIPILMNPNIKDLGIGYEKVSIQKKVSELAAKYNKILKTYMYPQFDSEFEYE